MNEAEGEESGGQIGKNLGGTLYLLAMSIGVTIDRSHHKLADK